MTSKNLTVTAAAVVALSAGAFMAGRMSASGDKHDSTADGTSAAMPARASSRSGGNGGSDAVSPRDSAAKAARERMKHETALAGMQRINLINDPVERAQAWLDFVHSLDPAEFQSAVASFRDEGFTRDHMGEYSILLSAWAKTDPLSALDYAQANTGNPFARNTILSTWAADDPDGAINWAKQHHEGDGANPWMIGVIKGIASTDPTRASQLLNEMPYSAERGEALGSLVPYMLTQGGDAAKAWAATIKDDRLRAGAIGQIADSLARQDPAATAAWLATNRSDAANQAMDNVLSTWVEKDKTAATAYYESMPAGDARTNALRGIANTLAQQDPKAAGEYLDSHSADANDRTYQQFVWNSFQGSPETAVQYIAKIGDEGNRNGTYDRVLRGWLRNDFDAASSYISTATLPQDVKARMTKQIQDMQQRRQ
ncbi:MAG: hypothetical protein JWO82_1047 [Akkermansiaceae bacterium]|nr:hypothetical protein [Akkermansiaceae bacterium]